MGATSSIEWTDATWNPTVGCTRVSPGCKNCYALPFKELQLIPDRLTDPLGWRKPRRVFVNSMSDLFHYRVPDEFIDRVFGVMALARQHTFQVLTKRPERMAAYVARLRADSEGRYFLPALFEHVSVQFRDAGDEATRERFLQAAHDHQGQDGWPLRNVWLGTSVENQAAADERIPHLLRVPAAVRFLSCEPLLGPVEFSDASRRSDWAAMLGKKALTGIGWVIAGGESGPVARPMDPAWARSLRDQCVAANVPFFFKQWGEYLHTHPSELHLFPGEVIEFGNIRLQRVGKKAAGRVLDGREWSEFPTPAGDAP